MYGRVNAPVDESPLNRMIAGLVSTAAACACRVSRLMVPAYGRWRSRPWSQASSSWFYYGFSSMASEVGVSSVLVEENLFIWPGCFHKRAGAGGMAGSTIGDQVRQGGEILVSTNPRCCNSEHARRFDDRIVSRVAFPAFCTQNDWPRGMLATGEDSRRDGDHAIPDAGVDGCGRAIGDRLAHEVWRPSIPLLRILCLSLSGWAKANNLNVLLAQGHSRLFFQLEIAKKIGVIFFIAAVLFSLTALYLSVR